VGVFVDDGRQGEDQGGEVGGQGGGEGSKDVQSENKGHSVREGHVTNQTMELHAALLGLQAIDRLWSAGDVCVVITSSVYVINCMTKWIVRWEQTGWITKNKRVVRNVDTFKAMLHIVKKCSVTFVHHRVPPKSSLGYMIEDGVDALAIMDMLASAVSVDMLTSGDTLNSEESEPCEAQDPHALARQTACTGYAKALAEQAAQVGSRSGCYIKRGNMTVSL
jgi:ribonuclease HI